MATKRSRPPVLVADDAVVLRASEVAERMAGMSIREGAQLFGITPSWLWRFLRRNGFRPAQGWTRQGWKRP